MGKLSRNVGLTAYEIAEDNGPDRCFKGIKRESLGGERKRD